MEEKRKKWWDWFLIVFHLPEGWFLFYILCDQNETSDIDDDNGYNDDNDDDDDKNQEEQ